MNETLQTIANRYSCRAYTGRPVEREKLEAIAKAAIQAPSAMNRQPWQVIVITNKTLLDEMDADGIATLKGEALERFNKWGGKLFFNVPCMFLVLKKTGADLDTGILTQNISLAATSLGLGNVICGMARIPYSGERGEEFRSRIGIPEGWEFGMTVLLGYEAENAHDNERFSMREENYPDMSKVRFLG